MRSFCVCQTDKGEGRTLSTGAGASQELLPLQELSPTINVSEVTNEPTVHPRAGRELGRGLQERQEMLLSHCWPPWWGSLLS